MIKKKLNIYKQLYWDIKVPKDQVEQSWQNLKPLLNTPLRISHPFFRQGAMFLSLLLLFLLSIVSFTQAATPGTPLYRTRVLSDEIAAKISGRPELTMERRIKDVITASKKQPAKVDQATIEYSKALEQTQQKAEKNEEVTIRVSNSLDRQEQWLKEAIKDDPKSEAELAKILQKTEEVRKKIREEKRETEKTENTNKDKKQNRN